MPLTVMMLRLSLFDYSGSTTLQPVRQTTMP
jgi:hypothetical protein